MGLLSWRPLVRRATQADSCNQCDLCALNCHGGASTAPGEQWQASECLGCLNCTDSCRSDSLQFSMAVPWRKQPAEKRIRPFAAGDPCGGARRTDYTVPDALRAASPWAGLRAALAAPAGVVTGARVPETLHGLWPVHQRLPDRWAATVAHRGGARGAVDAAFGAVGRLLRFHLHPLRAGLPHRGHPTAPGRGEAEVPHRACSLRHDAVHSLRLWPGLHRLRRALPDSGQGPSMSWRCRSPTATGNSARSSSRTSIRTSAFGCGICENVCPFDDQAGIRVRSANESRHETGLHPNLPIPPGGGFDGVY